MTNTGYAESDRRESDETLLKRTYAAVQWRLLPILFCMWMLAWVDRSNIAFAKLQMLGDLKFSETVYGFGAGLFFIGYVLFPVPAAMLQRRYGAGRVLSCMAIGWGSTSVLMMFVHSKAEFYALRLLLGMFEAGFYPGVVIYFNSWFAGRRRARNFSIFHTGATVSTMVVGLTGGLVLGNMNGVAGFEGWRWMFFFQAVPTVLLAAFSFFVLPDRPETARWLSDRQRKLLDEDLLRTPELSGAHGVAPRSALFDSSVWVLGLTYFCIISAASALVFFAPTVIRESGLHSFGDIGMAVAGTSILGAIGNILISTLGGDAHRRKAFCAFATATTAFCLLTLTYVWHSSPTLTICVLALGFAGSGASISLFWQLTVGLLDKKIISLGVPVINSIANLSGFITPFVIGYVRDTTGTYTSGFVMAACVQAVGFILVLAGTHYIVHRHARRDAVPLFNAV